MTMPSRQFVLAGFALAMSWTSLGLAQTPTPAPASPPAAEAPATKPSAAQAQAPAPQPEAPSTLPANPKHIFVVIPSYNVSYRSQVPALTPREKWHEYAEGVYDPIGLAAGAVEAGLEHSKTDGFCGYGSGLDSFSKCYGSALLDSTDSSFFGDFLFPVWWHQDPRYFRLGEGSWGKRAWYSLTRVVIARTDGGGDTFDSSALSGTALAAGVANLYYPHQDRGWGLTMSRVAWDLGGTAIFNLEAEFWPDVKGALGHIF